MLFPPLGIPFIFHATLCSMPVLHVCRGKNKTLYLPYKKYNSYPQLLGGNLQTLEISHLI